VSRDELAARRAAAAGHPSTFQPEGARGHPRSGTDGGYQAAASPFGGASGASNAGADSGPCPDRGQAAALLPARRTREWPATATAPRDARRFACEALRDWQRHDLEDVAALVVSELATNSVVHAQTGFVLCIEELDAGVLLRVSDPSPHLPSIQQTDGSHPSGRGLRIIAALADEWGAGTDDEGGKTVWALLQQPRP